MASILKHLFATADVYMCIWLFFVCSSQGKQLVLPEGKEHTILCRSPAETKYLITWVANGAPIDDDHLIFTVGEERQLTGGEKGRNVTFIPTPDVNSTSLKCAVIDVIDFANSFEPLDFTIIVQGFLSAPDVVYYVKEPSALFKWSPPFSHDITDVEPDISHYVVTIFNMEDHSVLDTVNTTHTEYLLQSEECQLNDYQVEIAAVNVVGVGEKYISPSFTLEELNFTDYTIHLSGKHPFIILKMETTCSDVILFSVQLIPTYSRFTVNISNTSSSEQMMLTLSSEEINFNEQYKATVCIEGAPTFKHHFTLSTFGVQTVEVTEYSGYVHIICHFGHGSKVAACRVVITPLVDAHSITSDDCEYVYTASRRPGSSEAGAVVVLPNGGYSVEVFDGEEATAGNPAYSTVLKVLFSHLHETTGCSNTSETNISEQNNCQCNYQLFVGLLVALVVLVLTVLVSAVLLIVWSKKPWKKPMSTDKQEYDMDENPVYAICGKSQSKHTESSTVSHEYEIVVPSTKERRSTSTL